MIPCASFLVVNSENNNNHSGDSFDEDAVVLRNKAAKTSIWRRPNSLVNLLNPAKKRTSVSSTSSTVYESTSTPDDEDTGSKIVRYSQSIGKEERDGTALSVVVVEAKGLPNVPGDGSSHGIYCKLRLGSQTLKSKSVPNSQHPVWQERLYFHRFKHNLLRVSLWDKGKEKNFMGSCVVDLSGLEKQRTHEVWQTLDDGYGMVHLSVALCNIHKSQSSDETFGNDLKDKHALFNLHDWKLVGELHVRVVAAKGLSGKPYCILDVDNERVRTHSDSSSEITWNKSFVFKVYDVTSTLDVKVYDSSVVSLVPPFRYECLGRVSIPLLRVNNGEMRWFALKDRSNRIARGNCPRVLLEMSLYWNPIKASLKVFTPKEVKYNKKSPKFDISLVYKNLEFIKDALHCFVDINEAYKNFLEWENRELSGIVLVSWLLFWYNFQMWATPLLLLIPFCYFWISNRHNQEKSFMRGYGIVEACESNGKDKHERSLTGRIQELPDMTIIITQGIQYLASLAEKMYNLASFKVPFLSYLTMFLLVVSSIGLYLIPFNYIMMIFGLYKFSRKYFDPERVLNNDLVDFLSRIPDTEELNNWKELNVPEPFPRISDGKFKQN